MISKDSNGSNILKQLCIIQADFDIWSGKSRLAPEDLKLGIGGEIPSEKIAQLGTKRLCAPERLRGFYRLKSETRRTLESIGMPFMNGFAIPASRLPEVADRLVNVEKEFKLLKDEFLLTYKQAVDEWCIHNPEFEKAVRAGAPAQEVIDRRIGFEFQVFHIAPSNMEGQLGDRLNVKVSGLSDELINDLTNEAEKFYEERLAGKVECGITTRMTLRNMRDKLDGLSFLNKKAEPLVKLIDELIEGYTKYAISRKVVAPFFHQLTSTVLILSSKTRIEQYLQGQLQVDNVVSDTAEVGRTTSEAAQRVFTLSNAEPLNCLFSVPQPAVEKVPPLSTSAVDENVAFEIEQMLNNSQFLTEVRPEQPGSFEHVVEGSDAQVSTQSSLDVQLLNLGIATPNVSNLVQSTPVLLEEVAEQGAFF